MKKIIALILLVSSFQTFARVTIMNCTFIAINGRGGPTITVQCEGEKDPLFACNNSKLAPGSECNDSIYECVQRTAISELSIYETELYTDVRGEEPYSMFENKKCSEK